MRLGGPQNRSGRRGEKKILDPTGTLRGTFAPQREGVTRGWRKLLSEELHNLYSSLNIIRAIKTRLG
jgi:hypothetical protein